MTCLTFLYKPKTVHAPSRLTSPSLRKLQNLQIKDIHTMQNLWIIFLYIQLIAWTDQELLDSSFAGSLILDVCDITLKFTIYGKRHCFGSKVWR